MLPPFEVRLCQQFDIPFISEYKKDEFSQEEGEVLVLIPDYLPEKELENLKCKLKPNEKLVSIFWLY